MVEPVRLRRLEAADVAAMRALNEVFGQAFDDRETYSGAPPSDDYLRELLSKPHVIVLVAEAGAQVVGGLVAYEFDKFERARREAYIYDLAVVEPHRRRGIASGLIRKLLEIEAARGAWVVFVQADYGDDPAIALYEKLGVREEVLHFDLTMPAS